MTRIKVISMFQPHRSCPFLVTIPLIPNILSIIFAVKILFLSGNGGERNEVLFFFTMYFFDVPTWQTKKCSQV